MNKIQDLTGDVYGKLTVLRFAGQNKHGISLWLCQCECGTEKVVNSMGMRAGKIKSCGCHRAAALKAGREALVASITTHGKSKTREHHIWQNMIYRCHTASCAAFPRYGGRGIKVCQRWLDSFEAFLADVGPLPSPKHSLDRYPDNDGDYRPGNVRWATKKEQAYNRRDNRPLFYKGTTRALCEWATLFNIHKATLHGRLRRGWTIAETLETRPGHKRN